jgi:hypothetical protein
VLDEHSTSELAQMRLDAVLRGVVLVGEDLAGRWRARAGAYPDGLVRAMLGRHLAFQGFGYAEDMLAARGDLLALYDLFCQVERQVLGALLGLNRLYLPNPGYKGMDELIGRMALTPPDLSARLKGALRLPPAEGVQRLHAVIEEVFDLVEANVPGVDTVPFRERMRHRRGVWDAPPAI